MSQLAISPQINLSTSSRYGDCPLCGSGLLIPGLQGIKCPKDGWIAQCKECQKWHKELTDGGFCNRCKVFKESQKKGRKS